MCVRVSTLKKLGRVGRDFFFFFLINAVFSVNDT